MGKRPSAGYYRDVCRQPRKICVSISFQNSTVLNVRFGGYLDE